MAAAAFINRQDPHLTGDGLTLTPTSSATIAAARTKPDIFSGRFSASGQASTAVETIVGKRLAFSAVSHDAATVVLQVSYDSGSTWTDVAFSAGTNSLVGQQFEIVEDAAGRQWRLHITALATNGVCDWLIRDLLAE